MARISGGFGVAVAGGVDVAHEAGGGAFGPAGAVGPVGTPGSVAVVHGAGHAEAVLEGGDRGGLRPDVGRRVLGHHILHHFLRAGGGLVDPHLDAGGARRVDAEVDVRLGAVVAAAEGERVDLAHRLRFIQRSARAHRRRRVARRDQDDGADQKGNPRRPRHSAHCLPPRRLVSQPDPESSQALPVKLPFGVTCLAAPRSGSRRPGSAPSSGQKSVGRGRLR